MNQINLNQIVVAMAALGASLSAVAAAASNAETPVRAQEVERAIAAGE